jgi:LuxR family transcriptional regulator, maltose regulon positive regulatory protein
MVGLSRLVPPELPPAYIVRPRLLDRLAGRWTHRLVTVLGGPGFGKTSLLAGAVVTAGRRADRVDVWLTCRPDDSDDAALLDGLGTSLGIGNTDLDGLLRAVWLLAPVHVCFVLDDAHEIRGGSSGATTIARLVDDLPGNGHLVVATRSTPALPLARLAARGQLDRITEADLVFTDDEMDQFAQQRGVRVASLRATGGWPALAELTAAAGDLVGEYVWDEVLVSIGPDRTRALARLGAIGAADDEIVAAAIGDVGGVRALTDGIPLVGWTGDGDREWARLHPLWEPVLRRHLTDVDAREARLAAGTVHRRHGRHDAAVDLYAAAGAWQHVLATVRDAAVRYGATEDWHRFARWHALLPDHLHHDPVAGLAAGLAIAARVPGDACVEFERAAAGFREAGDAAGELAVILKHGLVAWWSNDVLTLLALADRAAELAAAGHTDAGVVARIGAAAIAHVSGRPEAVLEQLATIDARRSGEWTVAVCWLRAVAHRRLGDLDRSHLALDEASRSAPHDVQLAIARSRADWLRGEVDTATEVLRAAVDHYRTARNRYLEVESSLELAARSAWLGDRGAARPLLDDVGADLAATPGALARVLWTVAVAASAIDAGDDETAARVIAGSAVARPGIAESWFWYDRAALALVYVLAPDDRAAWASGASAAVHRTGLELARTLVAARAGDVEVVARLEWPAAGMVLAHLPLAWAAELAGAASALGNSPPNELVDRLVGAGRPAGTEQRRTGALPGPAAELVVLGPVSIRRDGLMIDHPDLRRRRVRELLAVVALGRAQRRDEIAELMWPDTSDPRHNLRVTLGYLQRVLRDHALDTSLVCDQWSVRLVPSPRLHCDLWSFHRLLDAAERAERESDPQRALDHYGDALPLWHGDPFGDIADVDWLRDEQTRLRRRYVEMAVRAGHLHIAAGAVNLALAAASRALAADPYDEAAHVVLVRAHLADGDPGRARAAAESCLDSLADLGVTPSASAAELITTALGR